MSICDVILKQNCRESCSLLHPRDFRNVNDWFSCLLYTSDAADDMQCVDLGGRRIIKKMSGGRAASGGGSRGVGGGERGGGAGGGGGGGGRGGGGCLRNKARVIVFVAE